MVGSRKRRALLDLAVRLASGKADMQEADRLAKEKGEIGEMARALLSLADRMHWYESMLDAIPFPISVTDNDMKWTFINAASTGVMNRKRGEVGGVGCANWGADICNTERCGIAMLRRGQPTSEFRQPGLDRDFRVDAAFLTGRDGNRIGHIEVVQDVTPATSVLAYLKASVDRLAVVLAKWAQGNLSAPQQPLPPGNEYTGEVEAQMQLVSRHLTDLQERMVSGISTVRVNSENLGAASEQLGNAAGQTSQAVHQIASAIHEMASGISEQSQTASETSQMMDSFNRHVETIVRGIEGQAEAIGRVTEVSRRITDQGGITDKVTESFRKVEEMGSHSQEIGVMVETIDDIAAQTNLLALNAAIEAARAGEQGRGFAVVADEVRRLAERSQTATTQITKLVKTIQESVSASVADAGAAAAEIKVVSDALSGVIADVSRVAEESKRAVDQLTVHTREVLRATESMAGVSVENGATAEQIGAGAEEMSRQAQQVDEAVRALNHMATELQAVVGRFKLTDAPPPVSAGRLQPAL